MKKILDFLEKLEEKKIYYKLNKVRDAIMVEIAIPGERWEVDFLLMVTLKLKSLSVKVRFTMNLNLKPCFLI